MLKFGIIGFPLVHSLSPFMHNAALENAGIEGNYAVFETPPEKLEEQVNFFKEQRFRGFNVTIPHKLEIMKFLDSIDDFAKAVGAVNTVVIDENKKLYGYNTDVYGFVQAIPVEIRENLTGTKAAVIGAGGAAKAVLAGLREMGIAEIIVFARNPKSGEELLTENIELSKFSIVVNTTPVGMYGKNEGISPLSEKSVSTLPADAFIYDIIYKPRKTRLIEIAEKRDLKTLDGLEMLVLQGAKSFEFWTGQKPSVDVMREALLKVV